MAKQGGIYLVPVDLGPLTAACAASTYEQVAELLGCSRGYLHDLLHGLRPRVSVAQAARIEDRLGEPRGRMFGLAPADEQMLAPYARQAS